MSLLAIETKDEYDCLLQTLLACTEKKKLFITTKFLSNLVQQKECARPIQGCCTSGQLGQITRAREISIGATLKTVQSNCIHRSGLKVVALTITATA
jgi:hypothetical protein